MKKLLLSTIIASALIIPAGAYAAPNTDTPPPPAHTAPDHGNSTHEGPQHHKKGEKGPNSASRMEKHQAFMKDRFIKMEKELNIRPDQQPIWNKYVAAVMEMMTPMPRPEAGPKHEDMLPGERMADRFLAQKPKAERLKAVAGELRRTLDDGQMKRLKELNAEHIKRAMERPHHKAPAPKDAPAPAPEKTKP